MTQINFNVQRVSPRIWTWLLLLCGFVFLVTCIGHPIGVGQVGALMSSTLISEDLTCIAAGQLIGWGNLNAAIGISGCFAGIYLGDLGLWLLGRLVVRRIIAWPWALRLVKRGAAERRRRTAERQGWGGRVCGEVYPGIAATDLRRHGRGRCWDRGVQLLDLHRGRDLDAADCAARGACWRSYR